MRERTTSERNPALSRKLEYIQCSGELSVEEKDLRKCGRP